MTPIGWIRETLADHQERQEEKRQAREQERQQQQAIQQRQREAEQRALRLQRQRRAHGMADQGRLRHAGGVHQGDRPVGLGLDAGKRRTR